MQSAVCKRLVAVEYPWGTDPLVEQREGLVLAVDGPEYEHTVQREVKEQVVSALTGGRHSNRLEGGEEVVTPRSAAARQVLSGCVSDESKLAIGDSQIRSSSCGRGCGARSADREHPPEILRGNEVQRAAHRPGAHDLTGRECGLDRGIRAARGAQAHRPLHSREVLALHGEHPAHHIGGRPIRPLAEQL